MGKIYLSPAVHEHDRGCAYGEGCTENKHANEYLDELEVYLKASGIEWKRHRGDDVGEEGMKNAVRESNAYQPDLHYVVHTNAYDGSVKGSRPQIYKGSEKGRAYAEKILEYRREVYPYSCTIFERTDLYELRQTSAPCVYEELVFHDNEEDAKFLHEHMRELAKQSCRAICEMMGERFVDGYEEPGDVDGDGEVTAKDALMALKASAKGMELDAEQSERADVDADGTVTAADALHILKRSAGK